MKTYVTESTKNFSLFVLRMPLQLASVGTIDSPPTRYVWKRFSPRSKSSLRGTGTSGPLADVVALVVSADRGAAAVPQRRSMPRQWT